jgi:drug/metabolite transporter (DMT)-like permease
MYNLTHTLTDGLTLSALALLVLIVSPSSSTRASTCRIILRPSSNLSQALFVVFLWATSWVLITTFAFTLWNSTLRTLSVPESSIINGTMIIWIPVLAVLFLGETISMKEGFRLLVVAVGTLLVQMRRNG